MRLVRIEGITRVPAAWPPGELVMEVGGYGDRPGWWITVKGYDVPAV